MSKWVTLGVSILLLVFAYAALVVLTDWVR
jgi:hypothetical protein